MPRSCWKDTGLITKKLRELTKGKSVADLKDLIGTVKNRDLKQRLLTELEALKEQRTESPEVTPNYAFIAMAMDPKNPDLDDVLDALKEGASRCKIKAERVDEVQSNERITDRTLASIKEAEFVLVDLTYDRPNVYYEAGYAQGLGKTPVYVAQEGTKIHFDVKDYPVIKYPNKRTLKDSLEQRLRAIKSGRKLN